MAKARVAVLISGTGSNMAALLYASRIEDSPYEIVLVASNNPDAPGLKLAEAEGVATWAQNHQGMPRLAFDELIDEQLHDHDVEFVALAHVDDLNRGSMFLQRLRLDLEDAGEGEGERRP